MKKPRAVVPLDRNSSPVLGDTGADTLNASTDEFGATAPVRAAAKAAGAKAGASKSSAGVAVLPASRPAPVMNLSPHRGARANAPSAMAPPESAAAPPGHEVERTMVAQAAWRHSEEFNAHFSATHLGATTRRAVHLAAPDGESTDGGRRARFPITLVPTVGSARRLVVGFVDQGANAAELRSWNALLEVHGAAVANALDFPESEYDAFILGCRMWLGSKGYAVSMVEPAAAPASAVPAPERPRPSPALVGAIVVAVLAILALLVAR